MHLNIPPAVRQLKVRWSRLTYLAQADAVNDLVTRGISRRALARELGCSEALLRHLQKAVDLPEEIRSKVREGSISFRSAVRTISTRPTTEIRAESTSPSAKTPRAETAPKSPAVLDAPAYANLIVRFVRERCQFNRLDARQVVSQALNRILENGRGDELDHLYIPDPNFDQVIARCNPPAVPTEFGQFDHAINWLARWSVRVIPRSARAAAHKLAEQQLLVPAQ